MGQHGSVRYPVSGKKASSVLGMESVVKKNDV
jgi:hypothetical protein